MANKRSLAELLLAQRVGRGWTIVEVAAQTGLAESHISQIEKGKIKKPSMQLLYMLADVYGSNYKQLLAAAGYKLYEAAPKLTPAEQQEVAGFIAALLKRRHVPKSKKPTWVSL